MWKLVLPLITLIAAIALSAAADRPLPRADFTFINRGDITTLDVHQMSWMMDLRMARLLCEGLVRPNIFTREYTLEPAAAESLPEISYDGRTYTFHLRRDAKWSNGEPVTARDYLFSWRRAMLPENSTDYTTLFWLMEGGREFFDLRAADLAAHARRVKDLSASERREAARALWEKSCADFDRLVNLRAPDENTLVFTLSRRVPYFLDLMSMPVFYPVYPPLVSAHDTIDPDSGRVKTDPSWTKAGTFITNGPFRLMVWRFKRDMRLEANPYYWNLAALNVRSIAIPSVEDPNAAVMAFRTGAVDWVSDVNAGYRGELIAQKEAHFAEHRAEYEALVAQGLDPIEVDRRLPPDPRATMHAYPAFGTYFYNFNCRPALPDGRANPFADAKVRRAFSMSIDKEVLARDVRRSGEVATDVLIPPGSINGYRSPRGLAFDPARARALLAEAGYPDPTKFPVVEVLFNKDSGHDLIAEYIARQWQTNLGVPVQLTTKEIKVFRDDLRTGTFMTSRAGWYGDYGDPTTFLEINRTADGNNDRGYSNPTYDALLDRAETELDAGKRLQLLQEAERMIVEDELPLIPLFVQNNFYLFDAHRVSGVSSHPRSEQQLFRVDILGDGKGAEKALALPALAHPVEGGGGSP
ncbi:MAG: peptide ABC transporter substrate-binding protein [Phycisphaerales bacterium]|jgi:oligopeptide transport system substrate-binding protein|nr:peptide ABC transporter substrate-binding protein [Phycisphaerales bacterium]